MPRCLIVPALLALLACSPTQAPVEQPTPSASDVATAAAPQEEATPQRGGSPVPLVVHSADGALALLDPVTGARRELKQKAAIYFAGSIETGSTRPVVSPDGRWVAYLTEDGRNVKVTSLLDGETRSLTDLPGGADVETVISGWSPDSAGLLYHLGESGSLDDDLLPLPEGVTTGFYYAPVGEAPRKLDHIKAYTAWSRPGAVVDNAMKEGGAYALIEQPLDPSEPTRTLATVKGSYGFSQLQIRGGEVVYMRDGEAVRGKLGEEPTPITPAMDFATLQWPKLSPTGERVVILFDGKLALVEDAATPPRVLAPCGALCTVRWYGDDALVASSQTMGVVFIDLKAGTTRELTPDGGVVVIGSE